MLVSITDKVRFIESTLGSGKLARNCKNIDVRCPICAPKDSSKKKLAILVDNGMCHCWACGFKARTLIPLIRKFGTQDALLKYRDLFMTADQRAHMLPEMLEVEQRVELPKDFQLLALASTYDPDVRALKQYLTLRGLTDDDLWYYKLGFSNEFRWHRRVIMPSFDALGELNYFVARAVDAKRHPKYDNPDFDKLPIIFNELNIDWSQRLVLCEGGFDLVKCGDNTVPLLGSDLNDESALSIAIRVNSTPVALALDADMWETKTLKLAKKLMGYDIDVVIVDTRPFDDPGKASRAQFKEALEAAKPPTWEDAFMTRLSRASRVSL